MDQEKYRGTKRDRLLTLVISGQAELSQYSEDSNLGWFEDGIGLRWNWNVAKLITLSDGDLQKLLDSRSKGNKWSIDLRVLKTNKMKFQQIRKLIDVLVDDYYTTHFGGDKPSIDLTLHEASIYQLQEDMVKSYPDSLVYINNSSKPVGVAQQLNIDGFLINIHKLERVEPVVVDEVKLPKESIVIKRTYKTDPKKVKGKENKSE